MMYAKCPKCGAARYSASTQDWICECGFVIPKETLLPAGQEDRKEVRGCSVVANVIPSSLNRKFIRNIMD